MLMKLSIANMAHSRPEFGPHALGRLKEADQGAIDSVAAALAEKRLSRDETVGIMSRVAEGIVDCESFTDKARLRELYMKLRDSLGSVSLSPDEKDAGKIAEAMAEVTAFHLDAIQRYDDIIWLGFVSAENSAAMEEMTKGKAISTGAVLARAEGGQETLDSGFREVARKCLVNALYNGGTWTRFHASEVLSLYFGIETPGIAQSALEEALEKGEPRDIVAAEMYLRRLGTDARGAALERLEGMLGRGERIEEAARALRTLGREPKEIVEGLALSGSTDALKAYLHIYGRNSADIYSLAVMAGERPGAKLALASLSKSGEDRHIAMLAGRVMSIIRNRDELEGAESDLDFLRNYVLIPEEKFPAERLYVEMVFDSVAKVLNGCGKGEKKTAVAVLAASGASPGSLADNMDAHTLKLIRRNVENALLHALHSPDTRETAARGLERIGSDRVEDLLEKIARREGQSPVGAVASDTLASVAGKKMEKDIMLAEETVRAPRPPPPPKITRPAGVLRIN